MKTVKGVVGIAIFLAMCVGSFNYVESHDSTKLRNRVTRLEEKVGGLRTENVDLNNERIGIEAKLRQVCNALSKYKIEHIDCEEKESNDEGSQDESGN